ncbi:MAG: hypothetical protein A2104_07300 [Candidatus Melainabacteria bacterium GWF2_32_7]|nr:MAG: hypothetical protein A2104_07300 [Candidatus Melainabacteria bacterium GWF2_32_7]
MSLAGKYERDIAIWESNHIEDCKKLNLFKDKNVLEVGGALPKGYIDELNVKSWTCIDISNYSPIKDDNYEVIIGDISEYNFGDNVFDTVIATNSFEHINNLEKAMDNIYRILKPKGFLSSLFGPIWSCNKGHHLWVFTGEKYITFNDNIIPDWAHLLYAEQELREILTDKYTPRILDQILYQTYHSPEISNRLFYEDYIRIFDQTPFIFHELRNWHSPTFPNLDVQKILEEKYENKRNFNTFSMKILFQKN